MTLESKQRWMIRCWRFVFGYMAIGTVFGVSITIFGIDPRIVEESSVFLAVASTLGFLFLASMGAGIAFMYQIEPSVQLRGKSKDQLEKVLLDENLRLWHSKAAEMLETKAYNK